MAIADHVPGVSENSPRRTVVVVLCYLLLLPLVLVLFPFYLLYAVGTNRNGLADTLARSPLGVVPPIRHGGWESGVTLCLVGLVLVGSIGLLVPADALVDGGDQRAVETTSLEEYTPEAESQRTTPSTTPSDDAAVSTETRAVTPENDQTATTSAGELEIHHIDVGQADSTLLVTPDNETVLIDTGDWQDEGEQVISYLEQEGIDRIDHLIGTHPHADHIGGHADVIEHYEQNHDGIGKLYDTGLVHDTNTYEEYLDAVEKYGHELLIIEEGDELPLQSDGLSAQVLNPPTDSGDDIDTGSAAIVFEFGEIGYLVTGDLNGEGEQRLVNEHETDLAVDIYQVGHHGSSSSSTPAFLSAVDPTVAVVSSPRDSQFGHPHDEVLERFGKMGIETYWTAVHGNVVVETDGSSITVETTDQFSTDPTELLDKKHSARYTVVAAPPTAGIGLRPVIT